MPAPLLDDGLTDPTTSAEVCVELRRTRAELAAARAAWAPPVDDDSFDATRAALAAGRTPKDVRAGDWLDAFAWDVGRPVEPVRVTLEATPHPWLAGHVFVRLTERAASAQLPPDLGNLVVLLDVSVSMLTTPSRALPGISGTLRDANGQFPATSRLDIAHDALLRLTRRLPEDTTLAVARYSGARGVLLHPTSVRNRGAIALALEGVAAADLSTAEGASDAVDLVRKTSRDCADEHVVVVTDTNPSIALDPLDAVDRMARDGDLRVSVLSIGTAGPLAPLEELAHAGLGRAAYGWTSEEVEAAIFNLVTSRPSVARHLDVSVRFDPDRVAWVRQVEEDRDRLDADHVLSGWSRTVLWELALRPVTEGPIVTATWTAESAIPGAWSREGAHEIRVETLPETFADATPETRLASVIGLAAHSIVGGLPRGRSWDDLVALAEGAVRPEVPGDDRLPALVRLAADVAQRP